MARHQTKPFTKTEMKILIFNKMKRGMSYDQAKKEVSKEISMCLKNHKNEDEKKKDKEDQENTKNKTFKLEFEKLTHGKTKTD